MWVISAFCSGQRLIVGGQYSLSMTGLNVGDAGFEAATVRNKKMLYTAKNDKPLDGSTAPNIIAPTHAEIIGASGYPYPIEFTNIGGTGFFTDRNVIQFFDADGVTLLQSVFFDQTTEAIKPSENDPWVFITVPFDAANFVLSSGLVHISNTEIADITQIATELNGVTILKGTAFIINQGGDFGPYTGDAAAPDHSILNGAD